MPAAEATLLRRAVENNASWCAAVCAAHGDPGERLDGLWWHEAPTPCFYPNVVTTAPSTGADDLDPLIDRIDAASAERPWAVKDSYGGLELHDRGFDLLFAATWIAASPEVGVAHEPLSSVRSGDAAAWDRVVTPADLEAWEMAWSAGDPEGSGRVFPDAVLEDPRVHVLGRGDGKGDVGGGAIAFDAAGVVGLSNVFRTGGSEHDEARRDWRSLRDWAARTFPGRPIVGYERGEDLGPPHAEGLHPLGPLRVWERRR